MNDIPTALRDLARQEQFLDVVGSAEATARFHRHLKLRPLGSEIVPLSQALGRVLAHPVHADVDVPGFDRANVDGFAVRAVDTAGASARAPKVLTLNGEVLTPGNAPEIAVAADTATLIATGGMVPRGGFQWPGRRQRPGARRDRAAGRAGADLARDRHAGRGRHCSNRGLAAASRRDRFDRRRDRGAGRADPTRDGL